MPFSFLFCTCGILSSSNIRIFYLLCTKSSFEGSYHSTAVMVFRVTLPIICDHEKFYWWASWLISIVFQWTKLLKCCCICTKWQSDLVFFNQDLVIIDWWLKLFPSQTESSCPDFSWQFLYAIELKMIGLIVVVLVDGVFMFCRKWPDNYLRN
jgi:hypothetical protein